MIGPRTQELIERFNASGAQFHRVLAKPLVSFAMSIARALNALEDETALTMANDLTEMVGAVYDELPATVTALALELDKVERLMTPMVPAETLQRLQELQADAFDALDLELQARIDDPYYLLEEPADNGDLAAPEDSPESPAVEQTTTTTRPTTTTTTTTRPTTTTYPTPPKSFWTKGAKIGLGIAVPVFLGLVLVVSLVMSDGNDDDDEEEEDD